MTDVNGLDYWFPKIEAAGLPVPRTRIITFAGDLTPILDGVKPDGWDGLIEIIAIQAKDVGGEPYFLRTSHGSGKHDWKYTCYVNDGRLGSHVSALVEWSHNVTLMGLPHNVWVVRELLDTRVLFRCRAYGGFPVTREFRVFVRDGEVEHVQPYWPPEAVEQGSPDDPRWREKLDEASQIDTETMAEIAPLAVRAGLAVGGYWSVDLLQARDGLDDEGRDQWRWFITDMADGDESFRWGE